MKRAPLGSRSAGGVLSSLAHRCSSKCANSSPTIFLCYLVWSTRKNKYASTNYGIIITNLYCRKCSFTISTLQYFSVIWTGKHYHRCPKHNTEIITNLYNWWLDNYRVVWSVLFCQIDNSEIETPRKCLPWHCLDPGLTTMYLFIAIVISLPTIWRRYS